LITKSCPNCGATISFKEDQYEIYCDSCKREFLIQKNIPKDKEIEYVLVKRIITKPTNTKFVFLPIIICVIAIAIIAIMLMVKRGTDENIRRAQDSNYNYTSQSFALNDINTNKFNELKQLSIKTLEERNESSITKIEKDYEYVGTYLCKRNEKYIVIDVYESTQISELNKQFHFYGCVLHENVGMNNNQFYFSQSASLIGKNISAISGEYDEKSGLKGFILKGYFTLQEIKDYIVQDSNISLIDTIGNVI